MKKILLIQLLILFFSHLSLAKTRVGIYSGTFDPFHLGHQNLIQNAIKQINLHHLYIYPNLNPDHKQPKLPFEKRYHLLTLTLQDNPKVKVIDLHRLKELLETNDPHQSFFNWVKTNSPKNSVFYRLMGADSFERFLKYPSAVKALESVKDYYLVISKRKGHKIDIPNEFRGKVIILNQKSVSSYSSTRFRQDPLKNRYMLPSEVAKEIKENGYYQKNKNWSFLELFNSLF